MKLTDILTPDCVRVPMESADKTAAITELVDLLHAGGRISDRDAVLKAVLDRERTASTGIGNGLAVVERQRLVKLQHRLPDGLLFFQTIPPALGGT